MQGDGTRARRWIILMTSAITACFMIAVIGGSGSAAGAAADGTLPCVTPTALPTGTPATGTPGPSPTALPPPTATATAPQVIGRLLGDAPATATVTASPTTLPVCTPTPAPTKAPPTTTPIAQATAHSLGTPIASVAVATTIVGAAPTVNVAPSAVPARVSVQAAPIPASVVAPSFVSSSPSTSSSSSSAPPPAAAGLPPPPPPGYPAPVGNTPNSVGGSLPAFPSAFGTPVVSAVRGNVAAGAPSISYPGAPAARPALPPGYAVSPTGTAIPVVNPRAGHARPVRNTEFALLLGIVLMGVGARLLVIGDTAFAHDVRTRYTASALLRLRLGRNAREG